MNHYIRLDAYQQPLVASPPVNIPVTEFLKAFRYENEPVPLRKLPGKNYTDEDKKIFGAYPGKINTTLSKLRRNPNLQTKLIRLNEHSGIYFVVNAGGHEDKDIVRYTAVFCERDDISISEQHARLNQSPIPTSIRVETRNSVHAYWLLDDGCSESQWRDAQARLISYFHADASNKNLSRIMRLPSFNHVQKNLETNLVERKQIVCVEFQPERRYAIEEILTAFPKVDVKAKAPAHLYLPKAGYKVFDAEPFAGRYQQLKEWVIAQVQVFRRGKKDKEGNYSTPCPRHNGHGNTSFYLLATGAIGCHSCGTGREFLDGCIRNLNLKFKNTLTNQFYYQRGGLQV